MLYAFYSYKGGVGRSMALANLGELFHEQGLRTLLVDWDLEAPGLARGDGGLAVRAISPMHPSA